MNKLIIDTLKNIGIPVSFQVYTGSQTSYITFFFYNELGELYADNEEIQTGYYLQIDVWSKGDYIDIVCNVNEKMKTIRFIRTTAVDLYEQDTKIYHKALRFVKVN